MRVAPYSELQASVARLLGLDPDNLDDSEFAIIRDGVNRGLAAIARRVGALGFQRCEERWFRDHYASGTAYAAGDEVFFPPTQTYYQALRATTGNAPATESGGVWTENSAYWAACAKAYAAADYSATTAYVAGDLAYYPETGRFYQCHTASTGNLPSSTSYWGVLTAFDPYVPPIQTGFTTIGRVVGVFAENPRAFAGAPMLPWRRSEVGVQVYTEQPSVWIEFQVRPHRFNGTAWSSTATYTAVDDEAASASTAASGPRIIPPGAVAPEGVITANPGSIYVQIISSTVTQTWVKASGTGNTGWIG